MNVTATPVRAKDRGDSLDEAGIIAQYPYVIFFIS
jgi:hypothetical protein